MERELDERARLSNEKKEFRRLVAVDATRYFRNFTVTVDATFTVTARAPSHIHCGGRNDGFAGMFGRAGMFGLAGRARCATRWRQPPRARLSGGGGVSRSGALLHAALAASGMRAALLFAAATCSAVGSIPIGAGASSRTKTACGATR